MAERVITVEEIGAEPIDIVKVSVDDAGGVMFIGSITGADFAEWTDARDAGDAEAKKTAAAKLIVRSLVQGPEKPTDPEKLKAWDRGAAERRIGTDAMVPLFVRARMGRTERLIKAIFKLNYINQREETATKNA
jgi:hypothetical protein